MEPRQNWYKAGMSIITFNLQKRKRGRKSQEWHFGENF